MKVKIVVIAKEDEGRLKQSVKLVAKAKFSTVRRGGATLICFRKLARNDVSFLVRCVKS